MTHTIDIEDMPPTEDSERAQAEHILLLNFDERRKSLCCRSASCDADDLEQELQSVTTTNTYTHTTEGEIHTMSTRLQQCSEGNHVL